MIIINVLRFKQKTKKDIKIKMFLVLSKIHLIKINILGKESSCSTGCYRNNYHISKNLCWVISAAPTIYKNYNLFRFRIEKSPNKTEIFKDLKNIFPTSEKSFGASKKVYRLKTSSLT